jgi:hypothetical protein
MAEKETRVLEELFDRAVRDNLQKLATMPKRLKNELLD